MENDSPTKTGRATSLWTVILLVLVPAITYLTALPNGFVWIDHFEIENRGYIVQSQQDLNDVFSLTLDQYSSREGGIPLSGGGYFRPLYALCISLDYWLWEGNASAFHAVNVVWHILVVLCLYILGRAVLPERSLALLTALWFAVHPVSSQSVAWISGRKDAMCALFGMLALLAVLRAVRSRRVVLAIVWTALAIVATSASVLSKELGLVIPLAATLLVWFEPAWRTREDSSVQPSTTRRWPARIMVLVGVSVPCAMLVWYRENQLGGFGLNASYPSDRAWINLATSARLFWWYAGRIVLPRTSFVSDSWEISTGTGIFDFASVICLGVLLVVTAAGIWHRRPWAFGVAFFLIWLIPATGIVPLRHFRAERYLYPASWGALLVVVTALRHFASRLRIDIDRIAEGIDGQDREALAEQLRLRFAVVGLIIIVTWSALVTSWGNRLWSDDQTLFADAIRRDVNYAEGHSGMLTVAMHDQDWSEAIRYGERVLAIDEDSNVLSYWSPYVTRNNLGLAYLYSDRPEDALEQFRQVEQRWPNDSITSYHLGMAYFAIGDYEKTKLHARQRLQVAPDDFLARSHLAAAHLKLLEVEPALRLLEPLYLERPDDRTIMLNLANAYLLIEEDERALAVLSLLYNQSKSDVQVLRKLALCFWRLDRQQEALASIKLAMHFAPRDPDVLDLYQLISNEMENPSDE